MDEFQCEYFDVHKIWRQQTPTLCTCASRVSIWYREAVKTNLLPLPWVHSSATLVNPSFESHTNFDCAGLIAIQRGEHKHLIFGVHPGKFS
jgi:hypothetical protein